MRNKYCLEILDRSLKDVLGSQNGKPLSGKVVVFEGDFRQVLSVIPRVGRDQIVMSVLNSSYLWKHCKVLPLTKIMRLLAKYLSVKAVEDLKKFVEWILVVGDGKLSESNDGEALIDIPDEFLITGVDDPIKTIRRKVYGDPVSLQENNDPKFFQEKTILCPTNADVDMINELMLDNFQGEENVYLSSNSIHPADVSAITNHVLSQSF